MDEVECVLVKKCAVSVCVFIQIHSGSQFITVGDCVLMMVMMMMLLIV